MPESQTALMVRVGGDTRVHEIDVVLARGGAIAGTIVDSAGEPFQGVVVRALRLRQQDGRTLASSAGGRRDSPTIAAAIVYLDCQLGHTWSSRRLTPQKRRPDAPAPGILAVYYPATAHVESAQAVASGI
jgi:hypothetical protein